MNKLVRVLSASTTNNTAFGSFTYIFFFMFSLYFYSLPFTWEPLRGLFFMRRGA